MYNRAAGDEEPENDEGTSTIVFLPCASSFSLLVDPTDPLFLFLDLVDSVLAAINTEKVDLSNWTMGELSEFVRHFNYISEDVEDYLTQKLEETENQKRSDDMFDFDDEPSRGKAGTILSVASLPPLGPCILHFHPVYMATHF